MLESTCITFGDQFRQAEMVPESCKPELRDSGWGRVSSVFGDRGVLVVVFQRLLFTCLDLLRRRGRSTGDDSVPALVQRFLELEILSKKSQIWCQNRRREHTQSYLLFQLQTLPFVLVLELVLLDLNAFQSLDAEFDFHRQALDIP